MTPIDTPTTAALRALARTDEERARVELIISETRRAAEVSDRIDREQVAELASWAADTARLAPFNLGRRVRA